MFSLEYFKDESRFVDNTKVARAACLDCDRFERLPTRYEVSNEGEWFCPDCITQERLDKMITDGFLGDLDEQVQTALDILIKENADLKEDISNLQRDLAEAEQEYDELAREYDQLEAEFQEIQQDDDDE